MCVGSRSRSSDGSRWVAETKLVDLAGEVRKKLIGSKAVRRRRRRGVLVNWLRLASRGRRARRLLLVRRNKRFGIEHQLVLLLHLELRFWCFGLLLDRWFFLGGLRGRRWLRSEGWLARGCP